MCGCALICIHTPGADAGLLRGEGIHKIMHNAHAQKVDHAHIRHLTIWLAWIPRQKNNGSFIRNH